MKLSLEGPFEYRYAGRLPERILCLYSVRLVFFHFFVFVFFFFFFFSLYLLAAFIFLFFFFSFQFSSSSFSSSSTSSPAFIFVHISFSCIVAIFRARNSRCAANQKELRNRRGSFAETKAIPRDGSNENKYDATEERKHVETCQRLRKEGQIMSQITSHIDGNVGSETLGQWDREQGAAFEESKLNRTVKFFRTSRRQIQVVELSSRILYA